MKYKLFIFPVLLVAMLTLTGCMNDAQRRDVESAAWRKTLPAPNANYGSYPTNYEQLIKAHLSNSLKDPESARYGRFSKPRKEHVIKSDEAVYGYSVCVPVNAKNSYGGYTGNHTFWYFFRDGQIVRSKILMAIQALVFMAMLVRAE
ncbi:MAG: hypothetical protein IPP03_05670 [Dechloromonas sp.]|nr:hypothetical protein [Candidatus Dechloromonas phosphoritropha]